MEIFNQKINNKYSLVLNKKINHDFSIFNKIEFIDLHRKHFKKYFSANLIEDKTLKCKGVFTFGLRNNKEICSPLNGSYGGFEFTEDIYFDTKLNFIDAILEYIYSINPKSIEIILPPDIYALDNNSSQLSILFNRGFYTANIEINQYINVSKYNFQKSVNSGAKQRIKKCQRDALFFRELKYLEFKSAYDVVVENRKRRNYEISMRWEELDKMINIFPEKFKVFAIFNKKQDILASAICIKINNKILYVFYWGDIDGQEFYSPINFLSYEILNYCRSHNMEILDLGTSTKESKHNIGLINFKKGIGAKSCNKIKLKKVF